MTHEPEEMIHDLKAVEETFMAENGGCSPACFSYAVAAIKQLTAYEKAFEEIKRLPLAWEHGQGVQDCINIIEAHLQEATKEK